MAAEQGNVNAHFCLAVTYDDGQGVEQSDEEAERWYRMAADQGNAAVQFAWESPMKTVKGWIKTTRGHAMVSTGRRPGKS